MVYVKHVIQGITVTVTNEKGEKNKRKLEMWFNNKEHVRWIETNILFKKPEKVVKSLKRNGFKIENEKKFIVKMFKILDKVI